MYVSVSKPGAKEGKMETAARRVVNTIHSQSFSLLKCICVWETAGLQGQGFLGSSTNYKGKFLATQSFIRVKTISKRGRPFTLELATRTWVGGDETRRIHGSPSHRRGASPKPSVGWLSACQHSLRLYVCIPIHQELCWGMGGYRQIMKRAWALELDIWVATLAWPSISNPMRPFMLTKTT